MRQLLLRTGAVVVVIVS